MAGGPGRPRPAEGDTRRGLTPPGRRALAAAAVAYATGWFLGLWELYALAAIGAAVVALSTLRVMTRRPSLDVVRTVVPGRVHAGGRCTVRLSITNAGRSATPALQVHDPIARTSGANLMVAPLTPRETVTADYALPAERRGVHRVGPMVAGVADPFGLARAERPVAGVAEVVVLPRVERLTALPTTAGDDVVRGEDQATAVGRLGDDFHGLRPWTDGDDLRQVHWRSSARHDELLVRQVDEPWQGRLVVLLDVRRSTTDEVRFEQQVSAAASVLVASQRRGDRVRLLTTDGADSGWLESRADVEVALDMLARVAPGDTGRLARAVRILQTGGGAVVALLAAPGPGDVEALVRARPSSLTVVHFQRHVHEGPLRTEWSGTARAGRVRMVEVAPRSSFALAWDRALRERATLGAPA